MIYNYLVARMVRLGQSNTIVAVERSIWSSLILMANREGISLDQLCTYVQERYPESTPQIALRTYVGERYALENVTSQIRDADLVPFLEDAGIERNVTEKLHPEIITFLHIIAAVENCELPELLAYIAGLEAGRSPEDTVQHFVARYFYDCAVDGGPSRQQLPIRRKLRLRSTEPNANDNLN